MLRSAKYSDVREGYSTFCMHLWDPVFLLGLYKTHRVMHNVVDSYNIMDNLSIPNDMTSIVFSQMR